MTSGIYKKVIKKFSRKKIGKRPKYRRKKKKSEGVIYLPEEYIGKEVEVLILDCDKENEK